jgi:hypothetical protein
MNYGPASIKEVWGDSANSSSRKKKKSRSSAPHDQEILIGSKKYRPQVQYKPPPEVPAEDDDEVALMDEMMTPPPEQYATPQVAAAIRQQEMLAGINDDDDYDSYRESAMTVAGNWASYNQEPQQIRTPDVIRNIKTRGGNNTREGFRSRAPSDDDLLTQIADRLNELIDSMAGGGGGSRNPTIDVILYIFTGIFIIYVMNVFVKLGRN